MGEKTAKSPETKEEPVANAEPVESKDTPDDAGEENQQTVEVVREGKEGSQPDKQHGIRKRINKLNTKVSTAESTASDAQAELVREQEKTKLLTLALEQKTSSAAPPNPVDFDDGARDPKYVKALQDFNRPLIAAEVERQTKKLPAVQPDNTDLERRQTRHYERAEKLGAKDFNETEDKAIAILGNEVANHLIRNSDQSHMVLYYLGKHPDEAEEIARLIETNPIKATLQLGRLEAELNVKPKANSEPTPDPDAEIAGGTPSAGKTNKFQRQLDKAREAAQETGDIGAVLAVKKQAREAGVTVT